MRTAHVVSVRFVFRYQNYTLETIKVDIRCQPYCLQSASYTEVSCPSFHQQHSTRSYQRMGKKHLERYVTEFAGRHNVRELDTIDQMAFLAKGMVGKKLPYKELVS